MNKLEIEYVDINSIKPYKNNAKLHPAEQIEQIKKSIEEFGMNDPIGIWNNEIVEGHGRLIACKELKMEEVPVIRLDHLSDEERRAYILAHNKLTMNSDFDIEILHQELENILDINMQDFGFLDELEEENLDVIDDKYTKKIKIPQYEITGEEPDIKDLVDDFKTKELIDEIESANISEEQKEFLRKAAQRHLTFDYGRVAEYYAHQDKEMQELMEKSALVIIDVDDAIANGYVKLTEKLEEIINNEE